MGVCVCISSLHLCDHERYVVLCPFYRVENGSSITQPLRVIQAQASVLSSIFSSSTGVAGEIREQRKRQEVEVALFAVFHTVDSRH